MGTKQAKTFEECCDEVAKKLGQYVSEDHHKGCFYSRRVLKEAAELYASELIKERDELRKERDIFYKEKIEVTKSLSDGIDLIAKERDSLKQFNEGLINEIIILKALYRPHDWNNPFGDKAWERIESLLEKAKNQ